MYPPAAHCCGRVFCFIMFRGYPSFWPWSPHPNLFLQALRIVWSSNHRRSGNSITGIPAAGSAGFLVKAKLRRHFIWSRWSLLKASIGSSGGGIVTRLGSKFTTQFGPGFDPYITRSDIGLTISGFGDAVRGTGFEDSESNAESDEEEPIGLPHLDPNEGASVEWVRLSRGNRSYQLKLGNLKPVYEAMNTCMVNLVTYWGGDPELLRKRKTAPILTNLNLVAMQIQRHYPSQALSRGAQADLLIRAMVEADGTVSKCHITSLTQADLFDTEACRVMLKDAKFEPATDMDGRPMASYAIQRVLYRMSSNR